MRLRVHASILLVSVGTVPASAGPAGQLDPAHVSFFEKRVRPVLVNRCYQCHSAGKKIKGGLRLDHREGVVRGGDSGPVIVPGNPEKSLLITAIRHTDDDLKMPKKEKLPEQEIAALTKWVTLGAPDPRVEESEPFKAAEIDYEEGRKFWSFIPPARQNAPAVKDTSWPLTEIDRFILAAMEDKGLEPVADADRRTLVRRLCFDLIGLPPTVEQISAFLHDEGSIPEAVARLVDQLLASPHFGERWGRHWLDVARFSESNGMERNFTYPHAWRYRDYVIASFNKDKPYNQFIREQLAGDLLDETSTPGSTREERLTATGFLALGPKILNERDKQVFQMEMVDEQIDASTRAVLGLTVSCARCHDHKFDPIGTKDYYALAGIFTSSRTLYGTKGGGGNRQPAQLLAVGDEDPAQAAARENHQKTLKTVQGKLTKTTKQYQNLKKQSARNKGKKPGNAKKNSPGENTTGPEKRMAEMRSQMENMKKEVARLRKSAPPDPDFVMGVTEGTAADCRICLRGDPKKRGPAVERGFLNVIAASNQPPINDESSGRRELAEWMVARENPLAARVMVNRIWHHLFGAGLVRTVDNFGKMGETPSNPALLDQLAVNFMENGWSVKKLIRELTSSRVYQLSGNHHEKNYQLDPENRLCWQMSRRRLGAEAIRDAILQAGGQLETSPFPGSVLQELGDVNYGRSNAASFGKEVARHRSIYLPIIRNALPEALRVFDFAEPSLIVGRRQITTVATQALYLLNDPFVLEQTDAIARRLIDFSPEERERIDLAYTLTFGRPATTLERERSIALLQDISAGLSTENDEDRQRVAWATLAQGLIASAEFRYLN
jgi:hypothetical protein